MIGPSWKRLYLNTQQPEAALDLQDVNSPEADMLALLASARAVEVRPGDALDPER